MEILNEIANITYSSNFSREPGSSERFQEEGTGLRLFDPRLMKLNKDPTAHTLEKAKSKSNQRGADRAPS